MPSKVPFESQVIVQAHRKYSFTGTDGVDYRVNEPLTLLHFQDGMQYHVKGSISAKGNKYISEIVNTNAPQQVAQPTQVAGLPPLPPAPQPNVVPAPPPPVAQPTPPPVKAPEKKSPPPFKGKGDNVEGKVACEIGMGLTQGYLASTSQNEAEFLANYKSLLPQIITFHKEKGWM